MTITTSKRLGMHKPVAAKKYQLTKYIFGNTLKILSLYTHIIAILDPNEYEKKKNGHYWGVAVTMRLMKEASRNL